MRQSKVANFDARQLSLGLLLRAGPVKKQVLKFEVSVDDALLVNVLQCLQGILGISLKLILVGYRS